MTVFFHRFSRYKRGSYPDAHKNFFGDPFFDFNRNFNQTGLIGDAGRLTFN